jgi:hypothetical protein
MRTLLTLAAAVALTVAAHAQARYRTPWGDPDLQGTWSNATLTPLERPAALGDKQFWTEAEAAALDNNAIGQVLKNFAAGAATDGELSATWLEPGKVVRSRRTSLVVDPADGKVPYTPDGRKRWDAVPFLGRPLPADAPEDRTLAERCLGTDNILLPNPFYNNNHQIVQAPGYVALASEMMHEVRIIPLDRRPNPGARVTQWVGVSSGHWEGDTLVVETRNFNDKRLFRGATSTLGLVERLTRVDLATIDYQLTVTDPATFTRPWTMVNTLRTAPGRIFEMACHEANYGLAGILRGARAEEQRR